ncbi:ABC transporter ATP-binding protein [Ammoniphilus sp. CFH 90114]|uniref:ABC transporter ATP-binding protein n=1 Tax=Ammoniphilus sp. CFH 90114 TaxID=2493665 RepID=UPI00100FEAC9|nr:ABC transporter ATP-binding protein [Ammoniphilus sp. CFH 90114]RXT07291.1 ABC transporter ATP-binding protein [Ammoniphilus sp. CFH 90114]
MPGRPGGGGAARFQRQVVKPKDFKGTIKRLWSYFGKDKALLSTIFILILVDSIIVLFIPFLIGKAVDAIGLEETVQFRVLQITVLTLFIAYIANALLNFSQGWIMAGVAGRIVKRLRSHLFKKLQKLPLSFFDSRTHGELMSRLTNDIDNVSNSISQSTTQLMSGVIVLTGSFVMMLSLSPILTGASLITIPFMFFLTRTIARKTRVLFRDQQKELGLLNGQVEEMISGLEVIRAFNYEEKAMAEFKEVNNRLQKVGTRAQIWSGFLMPMMNVINNFGFMIVAVVGGYLAVQNMITIGLIASFITYSRQFVRPLNDLANTFNLLQSGVAGAERVFDILDHEEELEDHPEAIPLVNPKGVVEFKNVSFGYRPDVPIIKNVSFKSEAGSNTALIGTTGAGKTTILNLLTRFYEVSEGQILIDGRDIRKYTRESLRKCFGIVLQDTYLFSGTIMENIKYGNPDATDEEVKAATRMANADDFINRLPKGYETKLSENGGNLSHGQKQLLAISRVILSKPSLLILDEATSSIDTRTELHIQEALTKVLKGRTSFIIAHRLNTIRHADTIVVIENGEIKEKGNHVELMAEQGIYHQMILNQYKSLDRVQSVFTKL